MSNSERVGSIRARSQTNIDASTVSEYIYNSDIYICITDIVRYRFRYRRSETRRAAIWALVPCSDQNELSIGTSVRNFGSKRYIKTEETLPWKAPSLNGRRKVEPFCQAPLLSCSAVFESICRLSNRKASTGRLVTIRRRPIPRFYQNAQGIQTLGGAGSVGKVGVGHFAGTTAF